MKQARQFEARSREVSVSAPIGAWTRRARWMPALLIAGTLIIGGSGCGVSLHSGSSHVADASTLAASVSAVGHLPPRPQGEVDVDGATHGSLTAAAVASYEGSGARIALSNGGEAQGFSALCRGRTDIVDSRRPISAAELSTCQAYGVQPVQLEVAANGAVLATGGEVDVGADCITVAQVKQVFQAGSEIINWSQLGYYDIPLRVAGPQEGQGAFNLFGESALGTEAPTLASLRGDYEALPNEGAVRNAVTGGAAGATSAQLHGAALASLTSLRKAIGEAHGFVKSATFQVAKGVRDKRSTGARKRDSVNLAHANANLTMLTADLPAAERYVRQTTLAAVRFEKGLGTVGYFSLPYYEEHSEELRPLEVDSGSQRPRLNCIFPSAQTIADGAYPLSSQLLLTVSLQDMRRPEVVGFLRFYLAQAQNLASAAGLVPLPTTMLSTEVSWLDGRNQPPIISNAAPGGIAGGGSPGSGAAARSSTASSATPSALAPAGGAGDGVSSSDVPAGAGETSTTSSSEAPEGGAASQSAGTPQSSQPLIPGQ